MKHLINKVQYTTPLSQPQVRNPQVHNPQLNNPQVHNPKYTTPSIQPQVHNPKYTTPSTQPQVHNPKYTTPSTQPQVHPPKLSRNLVGVTRTLFFLYIIQRNLISGLALIATKPNSTEKRSDQNSKKLLSEVDNTSKM
jgi:hypothetical protein